MRSLLKAVPCAAVAAMLLCGDVSISTAQQASELDQLTKQVNELRKAGKYSEAIPLAQQVLAAREKALGPDHPGVATSLNSLAELLRLQARYADAEPLYHRSLAIRENALGRDHPNVAQSLNNLGLLYSSQGRRAQAEPLYQRALAQLAQNRPPAQDKSIA
jgi:tetratricopeptide (TPR) repeat protein